MTTKSTMWVLLLPNGKIAEWCGARRTRKEIIAYAAIGCISAKDYARCSNNSECWNVAYRHGYRVVPASVEFTP
jgi:hypothetical protein